LRVINTWLGIAKHMRVGRQEDAHEFLRYFVDGLQVSCTRSCSSYSAKVKETSLIHQIFGGYLQSQVSCSSCGHISRTFDALLDISLEIQNSDSIEKAFLQFTKPEMLSRANKYKCSSCSKLTDAQKQISIYAPPSILTIQLKRFDFTKSMFGKKISKYVAFPEHLDLKPYVSNRAMVRFFKTYIKAFGLFLSTLCRTSPFRL
jgi:ubiquitin C-terminal hydrolase